MTELERRSEIMECTPFIIPERKLRLEMRGVFCHPVQKWENWTLDPNFHCSFYQIRLSEIQRFGAGSDLRGLPTLSHFTGDKTEA